MFNLIEICQLISWFILDADENYRNLTCCLGAPVFLPA